MGSYRPLNPGDPAGARILVQAVEESSAAAIVTDAKQDVLYANAAFTRLTGYETGDILGRNCRVLQGPGTDRATVASIREALLNGRPFEGQILNYAKDGRPFYNLLAITPLHDEHDRITHFTSTQLDVTDSVEDRLITRQLLQTAHRLGEALDSDSIAEHVAAAVPALSGSDRASIALWSPDRTYMRIAAVSGLNDARADLARARRIDDRIPEFADVLRAEAPTFYRSADVSPVLREQLAAFGEGALAAVPVLSGGTVEGLLLAQWAGDGPNEAQVYSILDRLYSLASLSGIALKNARLLEDALNAGERDALTGLASRSVLDRSIVAALSGDDLQSTGIIYADIDRFKSANDLLGHGGGDVVLIEVAQRLQRAVRDGDVVARPGGDEFVILLPRVRNILDLEAVVSRLNRLMRAPITVDGAPVNITVAVGTAIRGPLRDGEPADKAVRALLRDADTAMYEAKKQRRLSPAPEPGT